MNVVGPNMFKCTHFSYRQGPLWFYSFDCPPRPEQLIKGVVAIQRMIDEEGIPPTGPGGRRVPLGIALQPTHSPRPQPVGIGLR